MEVAGPRAGGGSIFGDLAVSWVRPWFCDPTSRSECLFRWIQMLIRYICIKGTEDVGCLLVRIFVICEDTKNWGRIAPPPIIACRDWLSDYRSVMM